MPTNDRLTGTTSLGVVFNNTITRVTDDQRAQAVQGAQLTELIQNLYSIVLYDTTTGQTLAAEHLDPGNRTSAAEYFFRVPPKVLEMTEPFSTTVQPTQDGGRYAESFGSIIKNIKVSGTTGLRPNKSVSSLSRIPLIGSAAATFEGQLNTLAGSGLNGRQRGIPADEKTGWDDIIFLRNIFRKYSDVKLTDEFAGRVVMLWRNVKDADYWVVEPEDFHLSQNSQSPLTYEYQISFKTLARFDFTGIVAPRDSLAAARSAHRMLARIGEYNQTLLNAFLLISNQLNRVQGFASFLSTTILSPVLNVINGLNAVKTSAYGLVRGLGTQASTLLDNLTSAITQLNTSGSLPSQDPIMHSLRRLQIACAQILGESIAQEAPISDFARNIDRYANAYNTAGSGTTPLRSPSTSPTYIGYERHPSTLGSDRVGPGEDIRDLASRLLGDPARWHGLAALNRLRSPFVSVLGGPGVLMPGDSILFPQTGQAQNSVVGTNNPTPNGSPDDPITQAYGRDLRLVSNLVSGSELTDLMLGQDGDLAAIAGVPNVTQAISLKFVTERGELAAHPRYGAKAGVGRKSTSNSLNELRINTINTLMSDTRIIDVDKLQFVAIGDTVAADVSVVLTDARDILSTSLALRRF